MLTIAGSIDDGGAGGIAAGAWPVTRRTAFVATAVVIIIAAKLVVVTGCTAAGAAFRAGIKAN
jgi:hypothetical protein